VIPNIKLMKAGEAINVIEDLGLKVKKPNIRNWEKKLVKTISPAVGTKVKRGSTITITVG
jgi:beta-lactam-binding protein with PASTA domain